MGTAHDKRGENMDENHSEWLPNKSQVKMETRQRGRSFLEEQQHPRPEPINPFSLLLGKQMGG